MSAATATTTAAHEVSPWQSCKPSNDMPANWTDTKAVTLGLDVVVVVVGGGHYTDGRSGRRIGDDDSRSALLRATWIRDDARNQTASPRTNVNASRQNYLLHLSNWPTEYRITPRASWAKRQQPQDQKCGGFSTLPSLLNWKFAPGKISHGQGRSWRASLGRTMRNTSLKIEKKSWFQFLIIVLEKVFRSY